MTRINLALDNMRSYFGDTAFNDFVEEWEYATGMMLRDETDGAMFLKWFQVVHADLHSQRLTVSRSQ